MAGTVALVLAVAAMLGVSLFLIAAMVQSIRREKRSSGVRQTWKHFGLSIVFCGLFLLSWIAQGVAEWRTFVDEQRAHDEPVLVSDFVAEFSQSTLENWQSEFLQLFSFVVLSALLIHKGSAESKDSDEEMQRSLQRIEKRLDEIEQART